jgi:hypothetical protein
MISSLNVVLSMPRVFSHVSETRPLSAEGFHLLGGQLDDPRLSQVPDFSSPNLNCPDFLMNLGFEHGCLLRNHFSPFGLPPYSAWNFSSDNPHHKLRVVNPNWAIHNGFVPNLWQNFVMFPYISRIFQTTVIACNYESTKLIK